MFLADVVVPAVVRFLLLLPLA